MIQLGLFKQSLPLLPVTDATTLIDKEYLLPDAACTLQQWEAGRIITQTVQRPHLLWQRFIVHIHQATALYHKPTERQLLWIYIEKGNISHGLIEGCGQTSFREKELRLVYLPPDTAHFSYLPAGEYVFQVLSFSALATLPPEAMTSVYHIIMNAFHNNDSKGHVLGNVTAHQEIQQLITPLSLSLPADQHLQNLLQLYGAGLLVRRDKDDYNELDDERAWIVKNHVDKNPTEKHSLKDLRAKFEVSEHTLTKAFRNVFWQSLGNYIREIRLLHARTLMQGEGRVYVKITASILQWEPVHFGKQFNKRFGVPPIQFVKKKRNYHRQK